MHVSAIILAAGSAQRLKSKIPKPLVKIGPFAVITYSLKALSRHRLIRDIIVVVNASNRERVTKEIRRRGITKVRNIVEGGKRRQDSVLNGLSVMDKRTDVVLIHDAARPFISGSAISLVIGEAYRRGAAILAVPVKPTLKMVARPERHKSRRIVVEETLDRENIWEAQTPQVFKKDLILKAYRRFGNKDATDDASMVERSGVKPIIVPGSFSNIKITTPDDLVVAKAIARKWRTA